MNRRREQEHLNKWLRLSRASMVPPIRPDAPRILAGIGYSGTASAAETRLRRIEDGTASLTGRAGEIHTLPMAPVVGPHEWYTLVDHAVVVFRQQRIAELNATFPHQDG